jgi:hypothetical protein
LAAIRDWYKENGDDARANIIEKEYLLSRNLETLEPEPKLSLSKVDHDFYLKRVLSTDAAERAAARQAGESHERIHDAANIAAQHVRNIVAALPTTSKPQALFNRVNYLEQRAMVICVQVPDDGSAYVVFETMNDRGLRPSAADLLKNHLFGLADNREEEAEQHWIAMTGALETVPDVDDDIVVTYIRHVWIAQHGLTRNKELFGKIKNGIKAKQAAIDLTIELATNASFYSALLNPAHDMWNQYGPTRALQLKADGENEPQYVPNDSGEINPEHILPQSPSVAWKLNADEMKASFKRLGNLVLLQESENQLVGNSDYATKQPILTKSVFSLTKRAATYSQWTSKEINERQAMLAQLAVETWPLRP